LFFSGAAPHFHNTPNFGHESMVRVNRAAPLKNKRIIYKNVRFYTQVTPYRGFRNHTPSQNRPPAPDCVFPIMPGADPGFFSL
jgi:hypothetical protein